MKYIWRRSHIKKQVISYFRNEQGVIDRVINQYRGRSRVPLFEDGLTKEKDNQVWAQMLFMEETLFSIKIDPFWKIAKKFQNELIEASKDYAPILP